MVTMVTAEPIAPSYQHRVLHVVSQEARVVQRVLGLLDHGVHRALLDLMLYGPEQLVERLARRVLWRGRKADTIVASKR